MTRVPKTILAVAVFLLSSSFQDPQIRVEVEAVNVLATVAGDKGRFVTNLVQQNFQLYEDGRLQEITNFSQPTNLPLQIGLLIDTSSSVRLKLEFEKRAASDFLYSVMSYKDRALLVEFDTGVSLIHDFTRRPSSIIQSIKKLRAGGGTALIDAIYLVSRDKMFGGTDRKTMVILSDGQDLNSRHTLQEGIEMAHRAGVIIYAIGTTRFGTSVDDKGEKTLEELTENTGGRAFFPYSTERLAEAFDLINEELRTQYSLTFVPSNTQRDGKFREIELKLPKHKNLKIRHREGYFAPSE